MPDRNRVSPDILMVEDDTDIGHLVRYHLEKAGFTTRWFCNGNNVVAEAERQPPSLFLLDLMLPGIDGLQLCRSIRNSPLVGALPIIVLTARAGERDRSLALDSGADDYIVKPFRPSDLIARVRALARIVE